MNKQEALPEVLPDGSRILRVPGLEIKSQPQLNDPKKFDVSIITDLDPDKKWLYKKDVAGTQAMGYISGFERMFSKGPINDAKVAKNNIDIAMSLFAKEHIKHTIASKKELHKYADSCPMCEILKASSKEFSFDEFHKIEKQKGEPDIAGDTHNWAVHNKWEAYMKGQKSKIKSAEDYKKVSDEYWEKLFEKARK